MGGLHVVLIPTLVYQQRSQNITASAKTITKEVNMIEQDETKPIK